MKINSNVQKTLLTVGALVISTMPACSGEAPAPVHDRMTDVGLGEGALVTSVKLSETHAVNFYALEGGGVLVSEYYNFDYDAGPAIDAKELATVPAAVLYRRVAGTAFDAKIEAQLASLAPEGGETSGEVSKLELGQAAAPSQAEIVQKDFWSDLQFFSSTQCGGCLGVNGSRNGWEPASFPTCQTTPEVCEAYSKSGRQRWSSKNWSFAALNPEDSGNVTAGVYYTDPCEHDSWWSRTFSVCTKGSRIAFDTLPPHTVWAIGATNSTSWKRDFNVDGPGNVGIKVDVY